MNVRGPLSPARSSIEELVEKLPSTVQPKAHRIFEARPSLNALANSFSERAADEIETANSRERAKAHKSSGVAGRQMERALEAEYLDIDKAIARNRAAAERAREQAANYRSQASNAGQIEGAVRELIAAYPADRIREKRAKQRSGDTIQGLREAISAKTDEEANVQAASAPRAQLIKAVEAAVDQIAAVGEPRIDTRRRSGDPSRLVDKITLSIHGKSLVGEGAGPFLIWLMSDVIKMRMAELIPNDRNALTDAQQASKLAQIASEKLDLERREELLIEAAEREGRNVMRRPDASPLAVLGVEIIGDPR